MPQWAKCYVPHWACENRETTTQKMDGGDEEKENGFKF
jgi:hypothetical protein